MATTQRYDVKDLALAEEGKRRIEWADRMVDSFLPAHVVPLDPVPEIVATASAELAAMRGLQATAGAEMDGSRIDAIGTRLSRWAKSLPVRGLSVQTQQPVNMAITSTGATDPRDREAGAHFDAKLGQVTSGARAETLMKRRQ